MIDFSVLHPLIPLLNEADANWCIFSSAAHLLNGEDVYANDIDIMMTVEGAIRAEELLKEYRIWTPQKESGVYRSRRSHYIIKGIEIDLSGGLEKLSNGQWHPIKIQNVRITKEGLRYMI